MLKPDPTRVLYIAWDETEWVLVSDRGAKLWTQLRAVYRARWSNEATAEMIELATKYIEGNRPEAWLEIG